MRQQLKYTEISLDKENSEPLYLQLAGALRQQIGTACLNSNERMISERRLSEQLGVDRTTVDKAYCELLKEGLLTRRTSKTLCISAESRRKWWLRSRISVSSFRSSFSLIEANSLPLHYIKGIIDSAAARNISTIMIQLPDFNASYAEIDRFIDELAKRLIGVIHIGGRKVYPDRPLKRLMFEKLPQVMIPAYPHFPNVGTVTADPSSGGYALAEQIQALGHKKLGIIHYMPSIDAEGSDNYFVYEVYSRPGNCFRFLRSMDWIARIGLIVSGAGTFPLF
ncbi:MAG: GntR family transcriptional regulator [Victivallales bacterium]